VGLEGQGADQQVENEGLRLKYRVKGILKLAHDQSRRKIDGTARAKKNQRKDLTRGGTEMLGGGGTSPGELKILEFFPYFPRFHACGEV